MNIYYQILKDWCDKLIELQITDKTLPELYGGILCPSCGRIHGRCSDAMYPMLYLYKATGQEKYLDSAKGLFSWSKNMYHEEGFFYNDTNSDWKGITVFSAAQMGECLLDFGECLTEKEYNSILAIFRKCAEYLKDNIEKIGGNINYPITCAYTMAVAYKVMGDNQYAQKAKQLAHEAKNYITQEGLLYGEGHDREEISPKGCRPVDIGYNVEESLPALLQYALVMKDKEIYELVIKMMKVHMEFMLPDGAWDNSFGTRNYKWSYWGSRTSDGCITGYGLVDDPVFREVVKRNTLLLAKCTHQGLLYGGLMYVDAGEPPCVHHTFCHAKAFALLLQKASCKQIEALNNFQEKAQLPVDVRDGIVFFPSIQVLLIGKGSWRATITGYDVEYCKWGHPSGGAVSLLWNDKNGTVMIGTMGKYELIEPNNMQLLRRNTPCCLTPRIESSRFGKIYRSIYDRKAVMQWEENEDNICVYVTGRMTAGDGSQGKSYTIQYQFGTEQFKINAFCEEDNSILIIPEITKEKRKGNFRFSPVGGMLAVEIKIPATPKHTMEYIGHA